MGKSGRAILETACTLDYAAQNMGHEFDPSLLEIECAPVAIRRSVLRFLDLTDSRIDRLLVAESAGRIDMEGLFLARRGNQLVGAAWGQVIPGRTAFCWPPSVIPGESEDTAVQLQSTVDEYLNRRGVTVVQAVVAQRALTDAARLVRAGYRHLADLNYLICGADQFPRNEPVCDFRMEPAPQDDFERIAQLVARTYIGTLDCPGLDDSRPITEVLTGYRETGTFRPDWWWLARADGQDVGCLFLADHPEHGNCELMYLGMVPEVRGRGWGVQATRYAQWFLSREDRQRMLLAVDDENWPAMEVYAQTGFLEWDRRYIYVRSPQTTG
jgi:ribosomal protein S18 acetylase RimI-like enzyme